MKIKILLTEVTIEELGRLKELLATPAPAEPTKKAVEEPRFLPLINNEEVLDLLESMTNGYLIRFHSAISSRSKYGKIKVEDLDNKIVDRESFILYLEDRWAKAVERITNKAEPSYHQTVCRIAERIGVSIKVKDAYTAGVNIYFSPSEYPSNDNVPCQFIPTALLESRLVTISNPSQFLKGIKTRILKNDYERLFAAIKEIHHSRNNPKPVNKE